jgi:hypothetical protein
MKFFGSLDPLILSMSISKINLTYQGIPIKVGYSNVGISKNSTKYVCTIYNKCVIHNLRSHGCQGSSGFEGHGWSNVNMWHPFIGTL